MGPAIKPTPEEQLVEAVLNGSGATCDRRLDELTQAVNTFQPRTTRAVILGGGTGMSTVVGGNSARRSWSAAPFVGLKQEFARLDVVVCTTDDGGSTGELLKHLPMVGIGDLRKSCVSLVRAENPVFKTWLFIRKRTNHPFM